MSTPNDARSETPRTDKAWRIEDPEHKAGSIVLDDDRYRASVALERDLAARDEQIAALWKEGRAIGSGLCRIMAMAISGCADAAIVAQQEMGLEHAEAAVAKPADVAVNLRSRAEAAEARAAELEQRRVHVEQRLAELLRERNEAFDHLDDYGRTNPDLPSACFAAVESANRWRLEAEGLERDCREMARIARKLMALSDEEEKSFRSFAVKYSEKGGAS